jgi:ATP-binding cassette, subfamily B, bacterial MsbA
MQQLIRLIFREFPAETAGILALSLLVTGLEGIGMSMLLPILEGLNTPNNLQPSHSLSRAIVSVFELAGYTPTIVILFMVAITLLLLQAGVKFCQTSVVAWTTAKMEFLLRQRAFAALLTAQLSYFHDKRMGDLANGVVKEVERATAAFIHLTRIIVTGLLLIAYLSISLLISWELALFSGTIGVVLVLISSRRKKLVDRGVELRHANEELQSRTTENLIAIREIKIFELGERATSYFNFAAGGVSRVNFLMRRTVALRLALYEAMAMGAVFCIILFALTILGAESILVVAFLAILFRLRGSLIELQNNWDGMASQLPGLMAVNETIAESGRSHQNLKSGSTSISTLRSGIVLKDVDFAYDSETINALTGINIEILKGKVTAIVGASGAGKSTLVDLIVRFFDPSAGQVLIDGTDLRDLALDQWRAMIGFVSQETFLFNDTIEANIMIGRPNASRADIEDAASRAHAQEFIDKMPNGYDTRIGDRGVKLSGGQRQRLALARAILRNPPILVLDEATSGLDSRSEQYVQDSLAQMSKERTVVVIAHRLSTIRSADTIIVMEKGRVVEAGNHETLLKQGRHYAEFNELQYGQIS